MTDRYNEKAREIWGRCQTRGEFERAFRAAIAEARAEEREVLSDTLLQEIMKWSDEWLRDNEPYCDLLWRVGQVVGSRTESIKAQAADEARAEEREVLSDTLLQEIMKWSDEWNVNLRDNEPYYDLLWRVVGSHTESIKAQAADEARAEERERIFKKYGIADDETTQSD